MAATIRYKYSIWIRQYLHRDVSDISADKRSVIFRSIQKYIFDEDASAPLTENDDLVILNVQLNVSITLINNCSSKICSMKSYSHSLNEYYLILCNWNLIQLYLHWKKRKNEEKKNDLFMAHTHTHIPFKKNHFNCSLLCILFIWYWLHKSFLQVAEYGFNTIVKSVETTINNTLEGIPLINTIKHAIKTRRSQRKV